MARAIIDKYIHPKQHIINKIDHFVENNFKSLFIIGVHYRGTDKQHEAPRVLYKEVKNKVKQEIKQLKADYKIFVATDENAFVEYMKMVFPNKICYRSNAIRSDNRQPVHKRHQDQYKCGEDAVLDCILLSRTNLLIRTSSTLSLWSTYFNPDIPVFELNERYIP